jgi:hypothetical protein
MTSSLNLHAGMSCITMSIIGILGVVEEATNGDGFGFLKLCTVYPADL